MSSWTKQELTFLEDNYASLTINQLAAQLGRNASGVGAKCSRLGLKKGTNSGTFKPGHGPLRTYGPLKLVGKQKNYFAPGPRENREQRSQRIYSTRIRPLATATPVTALLEGWAWTKGKTSRHKTWHLFRGTSTLCGMYEIEDLTADELGEKPAVDSGKKCCRRCQTILDDEQAKGLPQEPALSSNDKEFIRQNYQAMTAPQLAQALGRENVDKVRMWAQSYCGRKEVNTGRFQKGQTPMSAKPGVHEVVRKDKRGVPYLHIRGGKWGWQYKHTAIWEAEHGAIPENHCVAFVNGNTLDCRLENLMLITRAENLDRNLGREELTDHYVAGMLSRKTLAATGERGIDEEQRELTLAQPELIEMKRNQLRLSRLIKIANEHDC